MKKVIRRKRTTIAVVVEEEWEILTPELKKEFLDQELNNLAKEAIIGFDGWGKRYKKGPRKGKKRRLYKVDNLKVLKILNFLNPYLHKCVWNSQKRNDPELLSLLQTEIWRLLREEGATNFSKLAKLRIMNWCTSYSNYDKQSRERDVNRSAISYYTVMTSDKEGNDIFLLDFLKDASFGGVNEGTILLNEKEKKLLNSFIYIGKKREKQKFYKKNEKALLDICHKLCD